MLPVSWLLNFCSSNHSATIYSHFNSCRNTLLLWKADTLTSKKDITLREKKKTGSSTGLFIYLAPRNCLPSRNNNKYINLSSIYLYIPSYLLDLSKPAAHDDVFHCFMCKMQTWMKIEILIESKFVLLRRRNGNVYTQWVK